MKKCLLITVGLLFLFSSLYSQVAQPESKPRKAYGGFANINLNFDFLSFSKLPGVPNCCPQFESGNGIGFALGGLYEYPLSRTFKLMFRGVLFLNTINLEDEESQTLSIEGKPTPALISHTLDANFMMFGAEPLVEYRLTKDLYLLGGLNLSFVGSSTFDQIEKLIEPKDYGTFENGTRERNPQSGDIPDALAFRVALLAGISYDLPLDADRKWLLAPEALFSFGLTPVVRGLSWNAASLRLGASLKYSPKKEIPPPMPPPQPTIPVPEPPPPVLEAALNVFIFDENNNEVPIISLIFQEIIVTELHPLLNYIFFNDNSSEIDKRYISLTKNEAARFEINSLNNLSTIDVYYQVLNILGKKLTDSPRAKIIVTGCNSNRGSEVGNITLSRSRAETVKDYLTSVWNISPDRVTTKAVNLPGNPSNSDDEDGMQENRRVEIYSDSLEITEPLVLRDTAHTANHKVIRFKPEVRSGAGVKDWQILISEKQEIKEFSSSGKPPEIIDWNVLKDIHTIPKDISYLSYYLGVEDLKKQVVKTNQLSIPVEYLTIEKKREENLQDTTIGSFRLILFDFNKTTLGQTNERVINIIKPYIQPNSIIVVTGYTDRIGEANYNQKLSEDRAKAAAKALGLDNATVQGLGESKEIFDNNLPEGRFYSRTVNILIKTPIR